MKRFAALYRELEANSSTLAKRAALARYFRGAPPEDAAWALYFLAGGKLSRIANGSELRDWVAACSGLPAWLVEDSYDHVGDLGETATLLLDDPPEHARVERGLREWVEDLLLPVAGTEPTRRRELVTQAWANLTEDQRLVFNKLITGSLRVGVAQRLVQQALAEISGVEITLIAQRMLGGTRPSASALQALLSPEPQTAIERSPIPSSSLRRSRACRKRWATSEIGCWNGNGTAFACR
jgi:DNA ligase-1